MSAPSTSPKRRRFQAPITTYFSSTALTSNRAPYSLPPSSPPPSNSTPTLPSTVQSSLLNVGMRIRKSVAEGYKTHHTLPSETWGGYTISKPAMATENDNNTKGNTSSAAASNELLPLCGLHKIGNLAVQTLPSLPSYATYGQHLSAAALEDPTNSLPSSQESISTTASHSQIPSRPKAKKKRAFETLADEDEEDDFFNNDRASGRAGSDFPFSFSHPSAPSFVRAGSWTTPLSPTHDSVANRAIAVPRSRRVELMSGARGDGKRGPEAAGVWMGMDQENLYTEDDGGDFGPVGFLRPRGECEGLYGDGDVEMG